MTFIDSALEAALPSGSFTAINKDDSLFPISLSAQAEKNIDNVLTHPSGQAVEAQDQEFEQNFLKSPSDARTPFEEAMEDVGFSDHIFSHGDSETVRRSIEHSNDIAETSSLSESEYTYGDIKNEALQLAKSGTQPEFCVKHRPKSKEKKVFHIETGEEVIMDFKMLCVEYGY